MGVDATRGRDPNIKSGAKYAAPSGLIHSAVLSASGGTMAANKHTDTNKRWQTTTHLGETEPTNSLQYDTVSLMFRPTPSQFLFCQPRQHLLQLCFFRRFCSRSSAEKQPSPPACGPKASRRCPWAGAPPARSWSSRPPVPATVPRSSQSWTPTPFSPPPVPPPVQEERGRPGTRPRV